MMDIPEYNIIELIDESYDEVDKKLRSLNLQVEKTAKKEKKDGKSSFVFVYCAGHGCTAKSEQYFILNSSKLKEALFGLQSRLRILSKSC